MIAIFCFIAKIDRFVICILPVYQFLNFITLKEIDDGLMDETDGLFSLVFGIEKKRLDTFDGAVAIC